VLEPVSFPADVKDVKDVQTLLVKSKTRVQVVLHTSLKARATGAIPLEKLTSMALEIGLRALTNRVCPDENCRVPRRRGYILESCPGLGCETPMEGIKLNPPKTSVKLSWPVFPVSSEMATRRGHELSASRRRPRGKTA
jgi:hypothetical protein